MAVSGLPDSNGGDEEEPGIVAEINVTPLTDIFLVLLIIFMVATTVIDDESKNIDLPSAEASEQAPEGVTVNVTADGRILIADREVESGGLLGALQDALDRSEDKLVILRGDRHVLLGQAVSILDLAQQAGAKGIALATQQPGEGEGG